jgi:PAS domain S-box-containing protein
VSSTGPVPRTFRRDARLFLSIALLLILFLNLVTLFFFRASAEWGTRQMEHRASEMVRRLAVSVGEPRDTLERVALESDVVFAALYDGLGRRVRGFGHEIEPPTSLPLAAPRPGEVRTEWRRNPSLLMAATASARGVFVVALDPGPGGTLRTDARWATVLVPLAGAAFAILAWLYLRTLLAPYDRLLAAAGSAPPASGPASIHADERDFLIARFESTIEALHEKEAELERLALAEKGRADDLEIAARTLARTLPTGLLSVDREARIVELNESGREMLGVSGEIRGGNLREALSRAPELATLVESVLTERESVTRQEVRWGEGERERVLGVTATAASGADGRFLGVLALFSDLSEVRRLEARVALARHLADLGEVSAGAAHEFRNAAAAIDGFANLAQRHPERAVEYLQSIRQEAQEMSRVTRDFLLFARPDQFLPTTVSLEEVADAAVAETEAAFPGISFARRGEFPDVPGSAVLLRRALVNLLRNAVEATPPGRREQPKALLLEGGSAEGEARLTVGDRGEGIDAASREKIFLPFYSSKPGGAGFGLAIVARIAELHGGTVEVTARPGGGSFFTLRLSLGAASPGSAPTAAPKSAGADSRAADPPAAGARQAPGGPPGKP